ncbi:DUF305 domain-containing protein [Streptomyces sp. HC307]|uniref:DUF305 domain-containing protein n=1 Tax=Streptomyces flavusporus TaxID=3385496 RepID=UPI0039175C1F
MNRKRSLARRTAVLAAAGAAALVLAACGGDGDSSTGHGSHGNSSASAAASASQGQHNAADVTFAQGMIPHHRQAVEMADLAPARAQSGEVKELAEQVKKAQDPEIRTLSGWLVSWGEDVPAEGAMDHSMHGGMEGMMSAEDMDELKTAKGTEFDKMFAEMMIEHHNGAIVMAKDEQQNGENAEAKKMAGDIVTGQSAEVTQLQNILDRL